MYPESPNRFWLVSALLLAIVFTVAFKNGEVAELDTYLNKRSGSGVVRVSQSLPLMVPKASEARVVFQDRLESGNYAFQVVIPGHEEQKIWILYYKGSSLELNGVVNGAPASAQSVTFMRDTPAIAQWVNPMNESVARSVEGSGGVTIPAMPSELEAHSSESVEDSLEDYGIRWEKSMSANSLKGRGLASQGF